MPNVSIPGQQKSYPIEKSSLLMHAHASIPFGCINGHCASCLVIILAGKENLSPASDTELETVQNYLNNHRRLKGENYLKEKTLRLACQARVLAGDITIKLLD